MPETVALIASAITAGSLATITATAFFTKVITDVLVIAALSGLSRLLAKKPDRPQLEITERKSFVQRPNPVRKIFYGEAQFAPSVFFFAEYDGTQHIIDPNNPPVVHSPTGIPTPTFIFSDNELLLACAVADHAFSSIEDIEINGESFLTTTEIQTLNTNGNVTILEGAPGASVLSLERTDTDKRAKEQVKRDYMKIYMGKSATGDFASAMDGAGVFPPKGYSSFAEAGMKLTGTSWIVFVLARSLDRNKEPIFLGTPQINIKVKRGLETLNKWTDIDSTITADNAALCTYDYLSRYTDYKNAVCGIGRIDLVSVRTAAAVCHSRDYKANGVVTLDDAPATVLSQLSYAMGGGSVTDNGGVASLFAGIGGTPTKIYTDRDIEEGTWSISTSVARHNRSNILVGRFIDAEGVLQTVSKRNTELAVDDHSSTEIDLVFVNNLTQASQVTGVLASRAWNQYIVNFSLKTDEKIPEPFEIVRCELISSGLVGDFRVLGIGRVKNGLVTVSMVLEHPDLYNNPVGDYLPPLRAPINLGENFITIDSDGGYILIDADGGRVRRV